MIRIAADDLVGTLSVQDDGHAVLAAELKDAELGERREAEGRLFHGANGVVDVVAHPCRVERRLVILEMR